MSLNYKCLINYKGNEKKKIGAKKSPYHAGGPIWVALLHSSLKHLLPVHYCVSPLKVL